MGRLREFLARERLDAVVVTDLVDIRYLAGFTGSSGLLAVTLSDASFFTDSRYTLQAGEEVRVAGTRTVRDLYGECAAFLNELGAGYVGLSKDSVTAAQHDRFRRLLPDSLLVDTARSVARLRMIKSPAELDKLREASRLAEEALKAAARLVAVGRTEREAALAFHLEALRLGAVGLSFDTIVAGGERGALPHATPGSRPFRDGDLVVFDFGIMLDGYCSDQTVTLGVGRVSEEARTVYEVVRRAQTAGIAAVRPGVALGEVDEAVRRVIGGAGYGGFFGHGTGHGLGLLVHEQPTVGPRSAEIAQPGMVFTVEPGIYLPDKFGVRLEDVVVVTDGGCERLTSLSKEFGVLG